MKVSKVNDLYVLNGYATVGDTSVPDNSEGKLKLWHFRLGYLSDKGFKELRNQGVFGNDKLDFSKFFKAYILGKAFRLKFKTIGHTTKDKLEYIHSNL